MTGTSARARWGNEDGAIVVHVALALFALTLMSAFVIDYGVQLLGRSETQNVADAAALAGATALAYDDYGDRTAGGAAEAAAKAVAARNAVWDGTAAVDVVADVSCADSWVWGRSAPPRLACIEVTASRDTAHGNPLPTYIAQLMGIRNSNINATAIGEAEDANSTDCLRPIAIPDRWQENYPAAAAWSGTSQFDRYDPMTGMLLPLNARDSYTAPDGLDAGTGMTMSDQFGVEVTLSAGSISTPVTTIKSWQYLPIQIPGSQWGADAVRNNTASCASSSTTKAPVSIGTRVHFATGDPVSDASLIASALRDLINRDPGAVWDAANHRVSASCADALPACASISPRIIAIGLYDPDDLAAAAYGGAPTGVLLQNFIGFFVESVNGTDITGRIVRHPGQIDTNTLYPLYDDSSFLRASMLVQ